MTYKEISKELDELKGKNDFVFQTAFYHLMDVGKQELTDDKVTETCAAIMAQDDGRSIINNELQCAIVETAGKIAKYNSAALALYFGKHFKGIERNLF